MKARTRVLATLLALLMTVSLLPVSSFAAGSRIGGFSGSYGITRDGFSYETSFTAVLDKNGQAATVKFKRTKLSIDSKIMKKYPEAQATLGALPTEGTAIYTVVPASQIGNKYYTGSDYVLKDPVWKGTSYPLSLGSAKEGMPLKADVLSEVAIPLREDNGKTAFEGIFLVGDSYLCPKLYYYGAVVTEEKFVFGEDSFSFTNSKASFYTNTSDKEAGPGLVYSDSNGYQLSPKYYAMLIEGLSPSEIAALNSMMNGKFVGNCFGMSAMSALLYAGDVKLSQLQSGAKNAYALKAPVQNIALRDAIVYYQLMQRLNSISLLRNNSGKNTTENAQSLVFDLKSNLPKPVIFVVYGDNWAHAMLAYDMEEMDSGYKILVYDPNDSQKPNVMTISKDYSSVSYSRQYSGTSLGMSMPLSMGFLKSAKFQTSLAPLKQPDLPENSTILTANTGTITIESGGETATFKDGKKVSGKLGVQCLGPTNEKDEEPEVIFYMNPPNGVKAPIIVRGGDRFRLTYQSIATRTSGEGLFAAVQSSKQSEIRFSSGGDCVVEVINPNGGEFHCGVASDKTKGKLFATSISSSSKKLTVTPSLTGATVKTEDGAKAKVTVSGATASVSFQDVNTASPVDITASDLVCNLVSDGKTLAEGTADSKGGAAGAPVEPDATKADSSVIANNMKKTSANNSNKIIDAMKHADDTSKRFENKGYPHSTWARVELARAQQLGLIPSSIQNKLNRNITRGEFADLVYETIKAVTGMTDDEMNALAKSPGSDNPYQNEYNSNSIRFVYGCGIVSGYPDGSFAANRYITRSEAAKMLVGMAELMGQTMYESGTKYFSDAPYDWSQSYIDKISGISSSYSGLAVMGGDQNGNFAPRGYYTCEQAVATMLRITERVIGQASGYSGGVIEIKPTSTASETDIDQTGYVPNAWSWIAEGEGYGRPYFTSGKYVRSDGKSVLYIESADSPDFFNYQIYTMPDGAKQDSYRVPSSGTQEHWSAQGMTGTLSYATANNSSETSATDTTEGLLFRAGNHTVTIESDWLDELYYQYSTPDGVYTLVREKK